MTLRIDQRDRIAAATARLQSAAANRPGFGRSTTVSVSRLGDRLRCTSTDGATTIESDAPKSLGGESAMPSPAAHLRAALGACLAMGYQIRAAERNVELTSVQVTVEEDTDVRGLLSETNEVPPGPLALRYHVDIVSPSDEETIRELVAIGDRLSPVLDTVVRPQSIERSVTITRSAF